MRKTEVSLCPQSKMKTVAAAHVLARQVGTRLTFS